MLALPSSSEEFEGHDHETCQHGVYWVQVGNRELNFIRIGFLPDELNRGCLYWPYAQHQE